MASSVRHAVLIPFLGALSALGPLSNDLYVPSLSLVASGLGVDAGSVQLTMSSLLVGFALGALVYGPLSDKFGRKPVLCLGLVVYVAAGALSAMATELAWLVAARTLQGLGASAGMVLARAIILDRWSGGEASRAMSWVSTFMFTMPVLAPIVGGYIASWGSWPTVFWVQAAAGALCLVVTVALLPRVGRASTMGVLQSLAAYGTILRDKHALGYMACTGFAFLGVIAFVVNSSFVLVDYFGLPPHQYGYCFALVMLGGSLGAFANGRLVLELGISRLISAGTALLAAGGVMSLVAAALGWGFLSILLPMLLYLFGIGFVLANATARTLSRFQGNFGAASAVFGVNQFLTGALVAAGLSLIKEPSPYPLTLVMAAAGLSCAAVWWGWLIRAPTVAD
jgi:MFS transporter, DHA1 family, multidrug resistance protein